MNHTQNGGSESMNGAMKAVSQDELGGPEVLRL